VDTWIHQMCHRSVVRQLVAWGIAVAIVGLLLFQSRAYIAGFVKGPRSMSGADLAQVQDPDGSPQYFVALQGPRTVETGVEEYTVRTENGEEVSREVSSIYYALQVGDRYVIVKSSGGIQNPVEGSLDEMPGDFESHFFASKEMRDQRALFYPFYLDASSYRAGGYWALTGLVAFLALLIWKAGPAWRRLRDPDSHPVLVRAATWGEPVSLSAGVERELHMAKRGKGGGWTLTDSYLVRRSFFTFDLLRFHDLIWAYKKITKHSVNFIPTGKTYAALMICYGGAAELAGSEKTVDGFLQFAAGRAPWAVFGYSAELAKAFKKDQPGFVAAVEQRRKQGAAQA
jgi:uncharacterized protein DUF6709